MSDGGRTVMVKLVERALEGIEQEPIGEQIDLHQAAAYALSQFDGQASDVAAHTAQLLREAERHQLKFRELLKS